MKYIDIWDFHGAAQGNNNFVFKRYVKKESTESGKPKMAMKFSLDKAWPMHEADVDVE